MSDLHVIVLAAGEGKRMNSDLPKVLHPLAGKPMLHHVIDTCVSIDATTVHVVYGHEGEKVRKASEAFNVAWAHQAEQKGTGHAVEQAMPNVPDDGIGLVLYGDVPLVNADTLKNVVKIAVDGGVGLVTAKLDDPSGYGRIVRDQQGRVAGIVEHKDASDEEREINECNMGIIAAPIPWLKGWLSRLEANNEQGEYYLTDIIGMAVAENVSVMAEHPKAVEETFGVNNRVQLAELERFYQRQQAERLMLGGATLMDPARVDVRGTVTTGKDVTIDINVVFEGHVVLEDNVCIGPNVVIKDSTIKVGTQIFANCVIDNARVGERCLVGPYARLRPEAELAEDVHVGNFVEVKKTRLGKGSKANHLTYLGDAQIGSGVNVGAGTITCNYDGANKHLTIIGDGAFIGSGVELIAPVTINDGATIGAGSTIAREAPAEKLTLTRGKQMTLDRWRRPVKEKKL